MYRQPLSYRVSRDPRVHIFSGPSITIAARALIAFVTLILLLTPSIICISSSSVTIRILVIVTATIVLVTALSAVARARTVDMFVVGAT